MIDSTKDLDSHKLYFHLEEVLNWKNGNLTYPIHLDIGPAGGCTNRCVHCYLKWYGHKERLLSEKVMDNIIDDGKVHNLKSIFLAGSGEPLLNPYTPEFICKAKKNGIDMAMATNGFLLDEKKADIIMPYINWIRFNVLAYSKEKFAKLHGCPIENRDIAFQNIKKFVEIRNRLKFDVGVGVGTCVLIEAIDEIEELVSYVKELGVDYISLRPVAINKRNNFFIDNENLYERLSKKFSEWQLKYSDNKFNVIIRHNLFKDAGIAKKNYKKCFGVHFINQIDANGGIYACGCFVGDERYLLGNLNEKSYSKIMASEKRFEVIKRVEDIPDIEYCDDFCRCHNINKYLWRYKKPPRDVNFI